jgi:hypothetical protein
MDRVSTDNKALRMPPAYAGAEKLEDKEISVLKRWVEQGAGWKMHWSLVPPKRPAIPAGANAIDYLAWERLKKEGLQPAARAKKHTLIRRATLDLTGLPPTPAEVEAFANDDAPGAFAKVIDRLLASPHYGEKMAIRWLDAARYADTNGYQTDAERYMWRWRDWVIEAFNRNLPYDQFIVHQLAGDLLPNPTLDQRIATGFNRNHRGNGEGGIIPEEYAVEYVVDRIETTSTVFLGLTMGCARCHDHKYDPLTQKEFYQFYAYFNNIPDRGKYFKYGNTPPFLPAPTPQQQEKLEGLRREMAFAETAFQAIPIGAAQSAWEKELAGGAEKDWHSKRDLAYQLDSAVLDGKSFVNAGDIAKFGFYDKFTVSAWIKPETGDAAIVTRAEDEVEGQGYGLYLKDGKLQVNMVSRWLDDAGRVESVDAIPLNRWHHVLFSYDGTREAEGIKVWLNGEPVKLKVLVDEMNQGFTVKEPLRVGGGGGYRFQGEIRDVRIYKVAAAATQVRVLALSENLNGLARLATRTAAQQEKLRGAFLDEFGPESIRTAWDSFVKAQNRYTTFRDSLPTVMVMQERQQPRDTYLLRRGVYDQPGEKVTRGVPAFLHKIPEGAPDNRLGVAQWLVDKRNTLTARVTVNRFWQAIFGTGLVKTVEDFGSQGEPPSHPELLDWLAVEFQESGWDVKRLLKAIMLSETYQQDSRVTPQALAADPENRLLSRGSRFRLAPEMVRDQALAFGGLLVGKIGGASVKPYMPESLWKELSGAEYKRDTGEGLYRRSMYTFWKRGAPPPGMMTFDSAGREACTVRESRTNTPLQALTLMNEVTFVEAARKMAERALKESPSDPAGYAFLLATARRPNEKEAAMLRESLNHFRDRFQTNRAAAEKLLKEGDSPADAAIDKAELAAHASLCSLIMNLDETLTKE